MTLDEYIEKHYQGNKSAFAAACDVKPQQITQWINKDFVVINGSLYSFRRELPIPPTETDKHASDSAQD